MRRIHLPGKHAFLLQLKQGLLYFFAAGQQRMLRLYGRVVLQKID